MLAVLALIAVLRARNVGPYAWSLSKASASVLHQVLAYLCCRV